MANTIKFSLYLYGKIMKKIQQLITSGINSKSPEIVFLTIVAITLVFTVAVPLFFMWITKL